MKYEKILPQGSGKTEDAEDISEDIDEMRLSRPKSRPVYLRVVPIITLISITATTLWLIITHSIISTPTPQPSSPSPSPSPSPSNLHLLNCTNTTTTSALTQTCAFDLLSYTWLPKPCIDTTTSTEFETWVRQPQRQYGSWPFFADKAGTQRINNIEELSLRVGLQTHTTQEEHLGHCAFMLRRLRRVREMKKVEEIKMDDMAHVVHCSEEILRGIKGPDPRDEGRLASIFVVGLGSCWVRV